MKLGLSMENWKQKLLLPGWLPGLNLSPGLNLLPGLNLNQQ